MHILFRLHQLTSISRYSPILSPHKFTVPQVLQFPRHLQGMMVMIIRFNSIKGVLLLLRYRPRVPSQGPLLPWKGNLLYNNPCIDRYLIPQYVFSSVNSNSLFYVGYWQPTKTWFERYILHSCFTVPRLTVPLVSPLAAQKNIDKSSIRHKFRVHSLVSKMANLLSPKKLNEEAEAM